MKAKADYAWKLSRKIIRELLTALLILVLTCMYVELSIIPDSGFVAEIRDVTLRRVVFHLIGAGVFCGIYLFIKFRNEDLKDRQFLNDTLNWNDRYLKLYMTPPALYSCFHSHPVNFCTAGSPYCPAVQASEILQRMCSETCKQSG